MKPEIVIRGIPQKVSEQIADAIVDNLLGGCPWDLLKTEKGCCADGCYYHWRQFIRIEPEEAQS